MKLIVIPGECWGGIGAQFELLRTAGCYCWVGCAELAPFVLARGDLFCLHGYIAIMSKLQEGEWVHSQIYSAELLPH